MQSQNPFSVAAKNFLMNRKKIMLFLILVMSLLTIQNSSACTSSFTYTFTGNTVQFTNTSIAPVTALTNGTLVTEAVPLPQILFMIISIPVTIMCASLFLIQLPAVTFTSATALCCPIHALQISHTR